MSLAVEVVEHGDQELFVKLKRAGVPSQHLPRAVHKLHEDWRPFLVVMLAVAMANTLTKLVAFGVWGFEFWRVGSPSLLSVV